MNVYFHCFSDGAVECGKWSHLSAVWTGNQWRLFLNGELVKESALVDASPQWTGMKMEIGAMAGSATFQGYIDEVEVFSGVLSAEAIRAEYAKGMK